MDAAQAPRVGRVYALIDGNSFYCSCERAFAPALNGRPVIVLSNNDGCAVARTPEAKALGIAMGAPFFKIRDLCRKNQVAVFSSNYTLYGDMSRRMNEIYHQFAPEVEVYSIDESFLDITGLGGGNYVAYGQQLRQTVRTWTGIPTCVGIGPTKTLAKLANRTAKNHPELNGVCDFSDRATREKYLPATPVGELWGVGAASAAKLKAIGVETVGQLRALEPKQGVSCSPWSASAQFMN
ncbi:Y-family DNA polymerase [Mesorhizobium sp. M0984]|uniref:Y-family DNA polymerase n=1 Tax=Mesorhizobium sp. M0984 TaxID=2957041 RepID=UPI00333B90E5